MTVRVRPRVRARARVRVRARARVRASLVGAVQHEGETTREPRRG